MYLTTEIKQNIYETHSPNGTKEDSGSAESQIALWTHRIIHLTEHLKQHPKDKSTQRGLLKLVGKRRRMLAYLRDTDITRYRKIRQDLKIRG